MTSQSQFPSDPAKLDKIIKMQAAVAEANFDLEAFMQTVVREMQNLTPATGVVIELVEGDEMVYRAATGTVANHIGLRLPMSTSISGLCVHSKKVLYSEDTEHDSRVNLEACRRVNARSLVVAPLFHDGKTEGVLKILSDKPNGFNDEDIKTLQLVAGLIASALAHQQFYDTTEKLLIERTNALYELRVAQKNLEYLAHYDSLTDLANRSLFFDKLKIALEQPNNKIALMFLDIDHFKKINDTFGHDVGDGLLKTFAARLKQCIRPADLAARVGGDEFILLIQDIKADQDAAAVAQKIVTKMNDPFKILDQNIKITTSIGIALNNQPNISGKELIKHADLALYNAKESGRNNYKFYDGINPSPI